MEKTNDKQRVLSACENPGGVEHGKDERQAKNLSACENPQG